MAKHDTNSKDLRGYQRAAADAQKPNQGAAAPGSGAAQSSYGGQRFGSNAGSGPNRSRDVSKPEVKQRPALPDQTRRELGRNK